MATIAVIGFVLAVGGITAVESASGQPLAAALGGDPDETGTTLGNVMPNPPAAPAPAPTSAPVASRNGGLTEGRSGGGATANQPPGPTGNAVPPTAASSPTPASALV